jgi:regulatory factor X-associated ankyrin-containing protein
MVPSGVEQGTGGISAAMSGSPRDRQTYSGETEGFSFLPVGSCLKHSTTLTNRQRGNEVSALPATLDCEWGLSGWGEPL